MVGLVQKILFQFIERQGGVEAVHEVKRRAGISPDRIFRIAEVYSDAEFRKLYSCSLEVLRLTEDQGVVGYAECFFADALSRFPEWFASSPNSRVLLEKQVVIHNVFASSLKNPEARKTVRDKFQIETFDDKVITHYRSPNQLCKLYRQIGKLVFDYYGDEAYFQEPKCVFKGDPECEIHIKWNKFGDKSPGKAA
jgi:hypothetical protein